MVACVAGLVGGLTKNVAAGIAIGGLVGAVAGAIGSAVVCYNTFDATYPFLKYSLSLTISCIVAGAVTGRLAAFAAKSKATKKNNPVIEKKENPGQIDIEEDLNSNGNNNPNPIEKEIINKDL